MGGFISGGISLCFPGYATVQTPLGTKRVCDLQVGEHVKVLRENGTAGWSPVYGWAHRDPEQDAAFVVLTTASGRITLSQDHLIPVLRSNGHHHHVRHHNEVDGMRYEYIFAGDVRMGDHLLQAAGAVGRSGDERPRMTPVTGLHTVQSRGIYAPLTLEGTVVVDSFAASCYAATHSHSAAHAALAPARSAFRHRPEGTAHRHAEKSGKQFTGALNYVDKLGRVKAHTSGLRHSQPTY